MGKMKKILLKQESVLQVSREMRAQLLKGKDLRKEIAKIINISDEPFFENRLPLVFL